MLATIIRAVIRRRALVLSVLAAALLAGAYLLPRTSLDAIPDISDPQLIVYVKWPRSPDLVEREVSGPLVRALLGTPGVRTVRATSHLGYAFVYVILRHEGWRERVRRRVQDRIQLLRARLPADARVELGPDASSLGWIYQYALVDRSGARDLREMRLLHEARVRGALEAVPGVAEVAPVGGLTRQIKLQLFPPLLAQYGITLAQIAAALEGVFQEVGGRNLEITNREYQVRGAVRAGGLDQLEYAVIGSAPDGRPVYLKDVGYLQVDYDLRRGIADLDGEGEVVGGIVVMEQGRNVLEVSAALRRAMEAVTASLPAGVELVPTYDRSELVWRNLENFFRALGWELGVVVLVIFWALRNGRAWLAPVVVILAGSLLTLLPMYLLGQTINLLSLAGLAIAIGEMADATIVIIEYCAAELRRRGPLGQRERLALVIRATARMTRPLLFSLLIILASFLPVFFLGEREGRLFDPLAYSKTFAMAFSTLLTVFLLPVIVAWVYRGPAVPRWTESGAGLARGYRRLLGWLIRWRYAFLAVNLGLLVAAVGALAGFQRKYMPEIDEGALLYMPTTLPGIPMKEAGWILQEIDRKLKAFPEVARVFGKLGRADTATDPAPVTMIETTVLLKPRSQWRPGLDRQALVAQMDAALRMVGFANAWTQPIAGRILMQETGIQTPVGVKISGPDLARVEALAARVEGLLRDYPGTASVIAERISSGYYLDVRLDLERLAAHGIAAADALQTVRYAVGGENVLRYRQADGSLVPLSVQYSPEYINTLAKIEQVTVVSDGGRSAPLGALGEVGVRKRPEMIRNDEGQPAGYVYIDIQGTTPTDYVRGAQAHLARHLALPDGYRLSWTGSHLYDQAAWMRLRWVIPLAFTIMFLLLTLAFRSLPLSGLILLSAPFALVGGVALQWLLGFEMTTAVAVGYLAVLGVAIQTGIIMVEFIREALARRTGAAGYTAAVIEGSVTRLRPKLMTVATTILGLVPILLSSGSGMEIMRPIAVPTVGGMVSSTVYVLFLIPCLFVIGHDLQGLWRRWRRRLAALDWRGGWR